MANTISDRTFREGYLKTRLSVLLRRALISVAICDVDNSGDKKIDNPYSSQPAVTQQALTGTYTVANWTTTEQALEVDQEIIVAEHIFDFEKRLTRFDLFNNRMDEMFYQVRAQADKWVLNELVNDAGATYTTPAKHFALVTNVPVIFGNLIATVAGYTEMYTGLFLVIHNTEMPGIIATQVGSGFSYADMALNNGFLMNYMGVDIYVTRTGTFVDATINGVAYTNANNRVFGVKGSSTFAFPREVMYEEKEVSLKTGKEIAVYGYIGHKLWEETSDLIVDVVLTP